MEGGGAIEPSRTRFLLVSPPTVTVPGDWGRRGAWHAEAMAIGGMNGDLEGELRTEGRRDGTKRFVCVS